jgi:hypothetical protein
MGKGKLVITILSLSNISRGKDLLILSQGSKSVGGCLQELSKTNSVFGIINLVGQEMA